MNKEWIPVFTGMTKRDLFSEKIIWWWRKNE